MPQKLIPNYSGKNTVESQTQERVQAKGVIAVNGEKHEKGI